MQNYLNYIIIDLEVRLNANFLMLRC